MTKIKQYLSLIKFSHTIFAMPFAMIGFFVAIKSSHYIDNKLIILPENNEIGHTVKSNVQWDFVFIRLLLVIICMITARSAAMAFNRWLDKNFDAKNPRTAIREIPAGIISANNALVFVIFNCIAFVIATSFINAICFYLSPVALFVILFYSYTKRFTPLCHLVLGLGLSLAPIGSYLAITGKFDVLPVLFSLTVLCWVSGFDIIYALQDEEFDKSQHLHSIPVLLGKKKALQLSTFLHFLCAGCIIIAGVYNQAGFLYWLGVVVFCGMLVYQHSIVSPVDLRRVNVAFMTANGVASIIFSAMVIADLYLKQ